MKRFFFIVVLLMLGGGLGWFVRPLNELPLQNSKKISEERKALYYQCSMHPWVRNDSMGRCTICGMELTPEHGTTNPVQSEDTLTLNASQIQVLSVQTTEVKKRLLLKTLRVAGMIDDDITKHRVLSSYLDGRIERLYLDCCFEITQGKPLADFYSPALLQVERDYRQLSGELRSHTALRLQQMGLAKEQIDALDQKPVDQFHSQILSPMSGTVVSRHVYEGQYVKEGDKLFEIADFSKMWFQCDVYENDMPWIQLGQTVEVSTPSLLARRAFGKIIFIDRNMDVMTQAVKVRVELDNPIVNGRRLFFHRGYADGHVKIEIPEVLTAPRSAVLQTDQDAVVYISQGAGLFERRKITLGRVGDTWVEILDGLQEGEKVVTQGLLLMDGQTEMNRAFLSSEKKCCA
jgi:Cu(I)/Ag(I) efflux system membrane fusion protein